MATVLPHFLTRRGKSIIICKSWVPGDLQVDLYSTGDQKVCNLYHGKIAEGTFMITWDGKDPQKRPSIMEIIKSDGQLAMDIVNFLLL